MKYPGYGIYDLTANRGSVFVGTSHDTPEFAAGNVARWWRDFGRQHYSKVSQLLILADSGGSNGARVRAWKYALQEQVADRFDLEVTVCHYTTGASNGIPLSIGSSAKSANTGRVILWTATQPSSA